MGRLAIVSDLHVDINQLKEVELGLLLEVLKEHQVTRLHLAGDTANQMARLLEVVTFFESEGLAVTYNLGNHEMPKLESERLIEAYDESHFLNQKAIPLNAQTVLLAFNGWYDYSYAVEKDHRKIVSSKNLYWYDRLITRGADDPTVLRGILTTLKHQLDQLEKAGKTVIIATHFVPKKAFIVYQEGKYERWNQLNAFLGSEETGRLFDGYSNIQQVVFGHTHRRFEDQIIAATRYSCRPFGYFFEWQLTRDFMEENQLMSQFNPMEVRGILKHHQPEFASYRLLHLKAEFLKGLTLIEY